MTEEEKKAIKYLKNEIERVNKENDFKKIPRAIVCLPLFIDYGETLLNLIEKLKKENEELKNKVVKRDNEIIQLEESAEKEFITKQEVKENYISKDKIREKIKELEQQKDLFFEKTVIQGRIDLLHELLEEE